MLASITDIFQIEGKAVFEAKMTSRNIEHFVVLEGPLHEIKTLLEDDTCSSILEESISN
ncbi:hypothetical protein Goshw_002568 [Gossypium schwendimanii]|uniref:Uncharacterized protein n=1 Tax=Gossypium schwendimanii TaxID=34291 RepID=A0A7J9MRG6_GOSSC|nr:hypothetical protein [Gossypium schwendimanii]